MIIKINAPDCTSSCIRALCSGEVVIIPTDTIYGFSGIVPSTEHKILAIKQRPKEKKMIRLIAEPADVYKYTDQIIPKAFFNLWPSPLTLIVRAKGGNDTIGFRCPNNDWLRSIIAKVGRPIYSSSVNVSGRQNLETISDIQKAFEKEVALIVDAGEIKGAASTVVDLTRDQPMILRRGAQAV